MHDLHGTDPTQLRQTYAAVDHADYAGPTRRHELDHTDQEQIIQIRNRSYRSGTDHTDQEQI